MMKKLFLLLFTAALALNVHADEAGHRAAAEELYNEMSPKETVLTSFMASYEPYMQQIAQMGVPAEAVAQIRKEGASLAEKIANDPELSKKMVAVYMETFTESELKEIIAFYKTPTGQKALKQLPVLFEKGAVIGQEIAMKYMPDFQEKVQQIMQSAMLDQAPAQSAPAEPAASGM
ncbi:DUF2059 domain-containing protein [Cerasicoccus maritimus]|uniref:DUF2059 domain-containing protein n=1 Tax=Cerasicoccus maritimus TaxID=490089 RepID=UPI002852B588|nr:DUF2059 domain-containing protein [Cerasicoccus maritimus]